MKITTIHLATGNRHKVQEIQRLADASGLALFGAALLAWQGTITPRAAPASAPAGQFSTERALRDIAVGEELTCDYAEFDQQFDPREVGG